MSIDTPGNVTYDGQPHQWKPTITDGGKTLVEGVDYEVVYDTDDFTDANGPITVTIKGLGNYEGTVEKTYRINPATLTVTTPSAAKVYDGTPLTAEGSYSGLVADETIEFSTTGTQTQVGSSKNAYRINWNGSAKQSNYNVVENLGTLVVTESADEVVMVVNGGEFTYDGQAHAATVTVVSVPTGYTVETATSNASATDATDEPVTATVDNLVIRNAEGADVTSSMKTNITAGEIVVNPAELVVTTPSAQKTYDGTALTAAGTISGFVNGETATFAPTGSQTAVGSSGNTFDIAWDGTANANNYEITASTGTLKVVEAASEVLVATTGGVFTYDGQPHGATVEVTGLPAGYTVQTAASTGSATNVAEGTVNVTADQLVIVNAAGEDVTSRLNIKYADGTVRITPATLTVTTGSATKAYDGTALTENTLRIDGLQGSDRVNAGATGSQLAVGSSENTYNITWGSTDSANYSIVENLGTLTVTAAVAPSTTPTTPTTPTNNGAAGRTTTTTPAPATTTPNPTLDSIADTLEGVYDGITGDTPDEEQIYDAETPLNQSPVQKHCWTHFFMIIGLILTVIYGVLVLLRRLTDKDGRKDDMKKIMKGEGGSDDDPTPAPSTEPQTMGA